MRDSLCCNPTAWQQEPAHLAEHKRNHSLPRDLLFANDSAKHCLRQGPAFPLKGGLHTDSSKEIVAVLRNFKHLQR